MTKNKLIVRICGGLGNQLFCYAAARRLALTNNAELVIDDTSGFSYDCLYQRKYQLDHFHIPCRKAKSWERLEPFSRIRRYLKRKINIRFPFEYRNFIIQEKTDYDQRLLELNFHGTVFMEGYWQSENYFKSIEETIRQDLRITPPTDKKNLCLAKNISRNNAVAVHARFFDEPNENSVHNAPSNYYKIATKKILETSHDAHFFLFSDRPEAAKKLISLPDNLITCVSHNIGDEAAYADLWLMTHCKHFIIANSTFSWWGAWLGENKQKQIIAPSFKIPNGKMSWGFNGLIPEEWICI